MSGAKISMPRFGRTAGSESTAFSDADGGIGRHDRRWTSALMGVARRLWPRKTANHLAALTGVSQRHAERLISDRTGISGNVLHDLLRSEEGFAFLKAVMHEPAPAWWEDFRYHVLAAETRADIAAARRRLTRAGNRRNRLYMRRT